jgi:hypothetical protein
MLSEAVQVFVSAQPTSFHTTYEVIKPFPVVCIIYSVELSGMPD